MDLGRLGSVGFLVLVSAGCSSTGTEDEARSLLGEPLTRPALPEASRRRHQDALDAARARWETSGQEIDAIWVGRQLGYLGRYRDAIAWYGARLRDFPGSVRLRRHRGHRYLTVRRLDDAIRDLAEAWELALGSEDALEPDGLPNAAGVPRSTTHGNVLYHLALGHWLQGDFDAAQRRFALAASLATNDDSRVAAWNWQVHALRRLGREDEAQAILAQVGETMDVLENHAYHRLLLLHHGVLGPQDLLGTEADGVQDATLAFGVSVWHLCRGETEAAQALWRRIVRETPWNAFGHLAAEAELARAKR